MRKLLQYYQILELMRGLLQLRKILLAFFFFTSTLPAKVESESSQAENQEETELIRLGRLLHCISLFCFSDLSNGAVCAANASTNNVSLLLQWCFSSILLVQLWGISTPLAVICLKALQAPPQMPACPCHGLVPYPFGVCLLHPVRQA